VKVKKVAFARALIRKPRFSDAQFTKSPACAKLRGVVETAGLE
jgi:hypothetical protein